MKIISKIQYGTKKLRAKIADENFDSALVLWVCLGQKKLQEQQSPDFDNEGSFLIGNGFKILHRGEDVLRKHLRTFENQISNTENQG